MLNYLQFGTLIHFCVEAEGLNTKEKKEKERKEGQGKDQKNNNR